jgi:hypothetical protein
MRNRRQTIESLRRLAERPGTAHEGETAHRLLEKMLGNGPKLRSFRAEDFPLLAEVWYAYWCYRNQHGYVASKTPKMIKGRIWVRIKFDHQKPPRWVPVTSNEGGCHLSRVRFSDQEAEFLHNCQLGKYVDFEELLAEVRRRAGFRPAEYTD